LGLLEASALGGNTPALECKLQSTGWNKSLTSTEKNLNDFQLSLQRLLT